MQVVQFGGADAVGGRARSSSAAARLAAATCLFSLAAALVFLAGCGRVQSKPAPANDGLAVTLVAEPSPPVVGQGTVVVTVKDSAGQPVEGLKITVEGNMSHAGMQPSFGQADSGAGGVYRASLQWTMAGDWYVDIKFSLPDGRTATRRFPITVR